MTGHELDCSKSQEPSDPEERCNVVDDLTAGLRVELTDWGVMDSNGTDYDKMMVVRFLMWAKASLAIEQRLKR